MADDFLDWLATKFDSPHCQAADDILKRLISPKLQLKELADQHPPMRHEIHDLIGLLSGMKSGQINRGNQRLAQKLGWVATSLHDEAARNEACELMWSCSIRQVLSVEGQDIKKRQPNLSR